MCTQNRTRILNGWECEVIIDHSIYEETDDVAYYRISCANWDLCILLQEVFDWVQKVIELIINRDVNYSYLYVQNYPRRSRNQTFYVQSLKLLNI